MTLGHPKLRDLVYGASDVSLCHAGLTMSKMLAFREHDWFLLDDPSLSTAVWRTKSGQVSRSAFNLDKLPNDQAYLETAIIKPDRPDFDFLLTATEYLRKSSSWFPLHGTIALDSLGKLCSLEGP